VIIMTDDKKEEKELSKNVEKLVEEISKLTVLELSELVSALQEKLGISAIPMAASNVATAVAPAGDTNTPAGEEAGGGGAQNLTMTVSGENKIAVIKALREINQNWGLKEAKDMTEQLPVEIIKGGKPEDVKAAAEKLKTAGATTEMK
jgi:large subunit ribosomal protein L7/L12